MAKTKEVLHAYLELGGSGLWSIYVEDDHDWSANMPLDATPGDRSGSNPRAEDVELGVLRRGIVPGGTQRPPSKEAWYELWQKLLETSKTEAV
jgi:hypothetical protein